MQFSQRDPIILALSLSLCVCVCVCVCVVEQENDMIARCSQLTMPEMKSQLMTAHEMYNHFKRLHYKNATMHGEILTRSLWKPVKCNAQRGSSTSKKLTFLSNKLR